MRLHTYIYIIYYPCLALLGQHFSIVDSHHFTHNGAAAPYNSNHYNYKWKNIYSLLLIYHNRYIYPKSVLHLLYTYIEAHNAFFIKQINLKNENFMNWELSVFCLSSRHRFAPVNWKKPEKIGWKCSFLSRDI